MNKFKFIDRDPHCQTRRVKEAIDIRQHSNNINMDNGIKIPEAWMLTIKKHNNRRTVLQQKREQLLIGIMRIESHQSQPTILLLIMMRNQSTSSPYKD